MENGDMLFAGKYSEPDFEMLLTEGCDLAIASMMISTPEGQGNDRAAGHRSLSTAPAMSLILDGPNGSSCMP